MTLIASGFSVYKEMYEFEARIAQKKAEIIGDILDLFPQVEDLENDLEKLALDESGKFGESCYSADQIQPLFDKVVEEYKAITEFVPFGPDYTQSMVLPKEKIAERGYGDRDVSEYHMAFIDVIQDRLENLCGWVHYSGVDVSKATIHEKTPLGRVLAAAEEINNPKK